jgi:predicted RNase H-like HicB family nuclease
LTHKYEIVLYWSDEDNAFIAEVPELAGCCADGKTRAEALENIEIVTREWIDVAQSIGREIPTARRRLESA